MIRLEDLKHGARITGILPKVAITAVDVHWIGSTAVKMTYKEPNGQAANQLLYCTSEAALGLVAAVVPLPAYLKPMCAKSLTVWRRRRVRRMSLPGSSSSWR